MRSKERANLRGEAHRLQPLVHVGHQGVTGSVVQATDDLLRTRELVKIDVSRNIDAPVREIAHALADATKAEVVQVIGRKVTIFRDNPDLEWKDNIPPWR